jgi:PAS domain S-box-containing protein
MTKRIATSPPTDSVVAASAGDRRPGDADAVQRLHHLRSMNRIAETIEATLDVQTAMQHVLETMLDIFDCDRAWLVDPLDPSAPSYRITFIATRPDWPPFLPPDYVLPMDGPGADILVEVAAASGPVAWSPRRPLPGGDIWRSNFGIRSQIMAALRPRGRVPWGLGIHHCRADREWTQPELELFQDIARRVGDMLGNLLLHGDLRRSEAHFRSLLGAIPQMVFITTPGGASIECNDRWYAYTGLTQAQTFGDGWLQAAHPDDRANAAQVWRDALPRGEPVELEFRMRRADGQFRWFLCRAVPVRDSDGSLLHWVGTCTDIDDQRKLEASVRANQEQLRRKDLRLANERLTAKAAELEQRNAELQEARLGLEQKARELQRASTFKSQFLANMSHELRTPLNSIIGFAQLLREGDVQVDAPEHQEFLGDILDSGRHLLRLINDILDLSKVEAGKIEVRLEEVDLAKLAAQAVTALSSVTLAKNINIEVAVSPQVPTIATDPGRLTQVLYNYLSNAVKFSEKDSTVWLRIRPEGADAVRFEVEDHGAGIDPEDLPRLYKAFEQLNEGAAKEHQGTGLGLALTKRLVELLGGRVGVTSAKGVGSVFHAILPLRVAVAPAPAVAIPDRAERKA